MAQSFRTAISFDGLASASSQALAIKVDGDSQNRVLVDAGGKITWGAGGSSAGDTTLYRSAANTLKTDDAFTAASLAVTGEFTLPTSDGSNNQVLVTNGSGTVSWANQTGGGGSPGGSDTQIQFNNSGSFGGSSNLTFDGTNLTLAGDATIGDTLILTGDSVSHISNNTSSGREILQLRGKTSNSNGAGMNLYGAGDSSNANKIKFFSSNSTSMTLDENGNLGIGDTTPSYKLDVNGTGRFTDNLTVDGNIDGQQDFTVGNGEGEFVLFQGSSNQVFVQANGDYRAYWNSSGHYLPYADSSYDLGGSSIRWRDAYTDSLTTGTAAVTLLNHSDTSSRDKIRVWNSSAYAIGMQSGITFGPLNDYAMTFQMNNNSSRGFWWGDTSHGTNQGAMALSTIGELYVPTSIKVGYGETNTSDTYSYDLQVSTDIRLNNLTLTSVDADGSMRVQGSGGYIDIGPKNTTYCHIYTDRGSFYFNKTTLYANSTSKKIWHRGDFRGGSANVSVNSSGYGTISHGLGATPDYAFVTSYTTLSSDNDNQLAFPVTGVNSSTITFRAYEINGNGNSNYTSSTIYNATVYVYWMAANF